MVFGFDELGFPEPNGRLMATFFINAAKVYADSVCDTADGLPA